MNRKYVYMMGGLGNQLFIYAFSRFLQRNGEAACLVLTSFRRDLLRDYKLYHYDIQIPTAKSLQSNIADKRIRMGVKGIFPWKKYVAPDTYEYMDAREAERYTYFYGYFQNSRYVDKYLEILRDELRYAGSFPDISEKLIREISVCNSVAVHVRRGDYLKASEYKIIDKNYYRDAMQYVRTYLQNPQFYFFSDDIGWCKEQFSNLDDIHFIDGMYGHNDIIDFEMLRCCKHFIIGNSTFSWWASKLSVSASKLLIAPKEWFTSPEASLKCRQELLDGYLLM